MTHFQGGPHSEDTPPFLSECTANCSIYRVLASHVKDNLLVAKGQVRVPSRYHRMYAGSDLVVGMIPEKEIQDDSLPLPLIRRNLLRPLHLRLVLE